MKASERLTLSRAQVLYVVLVVIVVLPAVAFLAFQPSVENVWCQQFEMPRYEKALGFRLGPIEYTLQSGEQREGLGIAWVDPAGAFARSGIRAGDFPRMHHGIRDVCAELASATQGDEAALDMINAADIGHGDAGRRIITVRIAAP